MAVDLVGALAEHRVELGLLELDIRAHLAVLVALREFEHPVVEGVETGKRGELERVAHGARFALESREHRTEAVLHVVEALGGAGPLQEGAVALVVVTRDERGRQCIGARDDDRGNTRDVRREPRRVHLQHEFVGVQWTPEAGLGVGEDGRHPVHRLVSRLGELDLPGAEQRC